MHQIYNIISRAALEVKPSYSTAVSGIITAAPDLNFGNSASPFKHDRSRRMLWSIFMAHGAHPDRVAQLYRLAPVAAVSNLFTGAIMVVALWNIIDNAWLLGWYSIVILQCMQFYKGRHLSKKLRITRISPRTLRLLSIMAVSCALPWSIALCAISLYTPSDVKFAYYVAPLMYALGGSLTLAGLPLLLVVYNVVMFVPTIIINFMIFDFVSLSMNLCSLFVIVMMVFFSLNHSIILSENEQRDVQRAADVTNIRKAHKAITELAETDTVTGLTNRRRFNEKLEAMLKKMDLACSRSHALLLIDLDHFKHINDAYGHDIGDRYLMRVGERLEKAAAQDFIVARLGGDEFALLSRTMIDQDALDKFANCLLDVLAEPHEFDGTSLKGGCSIGMALAPQHSTQPFELLTYADQALRTAKRSKRGSLVLFSAHDKADLQREKAQTLALEQAMINNEVTAVFQPQIDPKTSKLAGFEALGRWTMQGFGPVAPPVFFRLAEQHGFVLDLSEALWRNIGQTVKQWRMEGLDFGTISVNLHPAQLHHPRRMMKALEELASAAGGKQSIVLEITENCVIGRGMEEVPELLSDLHRQGYLISLDDFGTGFASLTQIKELPINELKIDRHFISDLPNDAQDRAIVKAICDIAAPRQIKVVAEGVETRQQLEVLASLGEVIVQGYYYSEPLAANDAMAYIATRHNLADAVEKAVRIRKGKRAKLATVTKTNSKSA